MVIWSFAPGRCASRGRGHRPPPETSSAACGARSSPRWTSPAAPGRRRGVDVLHGQRVEVDPGPRPASAGQRAARRARASAGLRSGGDATRRQDWRDRGRRCRLGRGLPDACIALIWAWVMRRFRVHHRLSCGRGRGRQFSLTSAGMMVGETPPTRRAQRKKDDDAHLHSGRTGFGRVDRPRHQNRHRPASRWTPPEAMAENYASVLRFTREQIAYMPLFARAFTVGPRPVVVDRPPNGELRTASAPLTHRPANTTVSRLQRRRSASPQPVPGTDTRSCGVVQAPA